VRAEDCPGLGRSAPLLGDFPDVASPPVFDPQVMTIEASASVTVDPDGRGSWEVVVPETHPHIACNTLDDARRIAYRTAARQPHCELIVRDAYHRVIVDTERRPPAAAQRR